MDCLLRVVKFCPKWTDEMEGEGKKDGRKDGNGEATTAAVEEEEEEAKMMERQTSGRREGEFSDGLAS